MRMDPIICHPGNLAASWKAQSISQRLGREEKNRDIYKLPSERKIIAYYGENRKVLNQTCHQSVEFSSQ